MKREYQSVGLINRESILDIFQRNSDCWLSIKDVLSYCALSDGSVRAHCQELKRFGYLIERKQREYNHRMKANIFVTRYRLKKELEANQ